MIVCRIYAYNIIHILHTFYIGFYTLQLLFIKYIYVHNIIYFVIHTISLHLTYVTYYVNYM